MLKEELEIFLAKADFEKLEEGVYAKKYLVKNEKLRNLRGEEKIQPVYLTIIYELKTSGTDTKVDVYYESKDTRVKRYTGKLSKLKINETDGSLDGLKILK